MGESKAGSVMTAAAVSVQRGGSVDVASAYDVFVDGLDIDSSNRWQRRRAARLFSERHGSVESWMRRPTSARLADLHRLKAWPFLTWLFLEGHVRPDLELLVAKPPGVDLGVWWTRANGPDVARATEIAARLGWSSNWTHQILAHGAPVLCLATHTPLFELTDADFDDVQRVVDESNIKLSTRHRFAGRCLALRQLCFQAGTIDVAPKDPRRPSLPPAEHAATISQPDIRRDAVRYATLVGATLRPATAQMRIKAIRVLAEWLAEYHPGAVRLDQIERVHIEQFVAWSRSRPFRGTNAKARTVGMTVFHHDLVDLRVFFEDIAEWNWSSAPQRRLLFLSDLPKLPEALPRALAPDADRAVMAAVALLEDPFAKCGLTLLRATGMRVGELLDLELDCVTDYIRHGTWLRVPLGKLGTERSVPLDPEPLALLDAWIANRSEQRTMIHPRQQRPADFVFVERGRRLGAHRLREGLATAVNAAGLTDRSGSPLHVTLHQLRHTFGTTLINAGMNLPALMALLGHVTPEMTLRYARLSSPTIRAAYDTAMTKVSQRRPIFTIPAGHTIAVPSRVDWLHNEMLKTRVAHGFCSRDPIAGACPYANICEQCDNFVPDPEATHTLTIQRDDIRTLEHDATTRGWTDEANRHHRTAETLDKHLDRINQTHPNTKST
jgi:integrase